MNRLRAHEHGLPLGPRFLSDPLLSGRPMAMRFGLLHMWFTQDCSLMTNALLYTPGSAPHALPWPGRTGRGSPSMDPSRLSHRYVRYVHYTAPEVLHEACMRTAPHGAYRASDTAALTARIGAFRFTSGWSLTRTAENRAQLMSDAPLTTCG